MRKHINGILALLACFIFLSSITWAAWRQPMESGLVIGDIFYASGPGEMSVITAVATGYVLGSAGVGTKPAFTATPSVTTLTATNVYSTHRVATPTVLAPTGTGTYTLSPTGKSLVYLNNVSNYAVILSETGAVDGQELEIVNISTGTAGFSDSAGVQELSGGAAVTLGVLDTLIFRYVVDSFDGAARWVMKSSTDN